MRDPVFQKFKFAAIKSLHDHWLSFLTSSNVLYIAHLVLPKNKQHFDWKISRKRRILWTIWLRKTRDSSCVNFNTARHKEASDVNNASFCHIRFKLASLLEFPFQWLFLYTSLSSLDITSWVLKGKLNADAAIECLRFLNTRPVERKQKWSCVFGSQHSKWDTFLTKRTTYKVQIQNKF